MPEAVRLLMDSLCRQLASTHFYRGAVYHVASKRKDTAPASTPDRSERSATTETCSSYKHLSVLGESMGRIFYGWVITGLSALANTLAWSVRSTFALFYVALLQEFR